LNEGATCVKNVLECISTIETDLKHAAVEAKGRVHIWRFKVEIVPKDQLDCVHEMTELRWVKTFVAHYSRIIDESGVGRRIGGWDGHSGIWCDP
jgi:hypothetical protein